MTFKARWKLVCIYLQIEYLIIFPLKHFLHFAQISFKKRQRQLQKQLLMTFKAGWNIH